MSKNVNNDVSKDPPYSNLNRMVHICMCFVKERICVYPLTAKINTRTRIRSRHLQRLGTQGNPC